MTNTDLELINVLKEHVREIIPCLEGNMDGKSFEHPLDSSVINKLKEINIKDSDDEYKLFQYIDTVKDIWKLAIEKSIKCLRFFDSREPFLDNKSKHPVAYGVDDLRKYYDNYTEFERMLYGGGKYYRDHVIHVFRVWLLGLKLLLSKDAEYLRNITVQHNADTNPFEKLSIWTIIALTHDLGYPLEKSQEIIEKTKEMMKSFVSNPTITLNTSFDGIQNNMNDYILRFISSKMHPLDNGKYVARLQPKFYFKFQKSLEKYKHGILSSIIIYKILLYFMESDFNINEDYKFSAEDVRQYYIRREILRTISAHTCTDIYHLDILTFSFLLIMVDDIQDWGRKTISDLYIDKHEKYELEDVYPKFKFSKSNPEKSNNDVKKGEGIVEKSKINVHRFIVKDAFRFNSDEKETINSTLIKLKKQCDVYERIFRDGQDTSKRNFSFEKITDILYYNKENESGQIQVIMQISYNKSPIFKVKSNSDKYNIDDIKKVFKEYLVKELHSKNKTYKTEVTIK